MKKLIFAAPVLLSLAACGTTSQPAHTGAFLTSSYTLSCNTYMSNAHPAQNAATVVHIRTQPLTKIFTVAFYRTVDRVYYGLANGDGQANVSFNIGDATSGRKVNVVVTVVQGNSAGRCATSFTPHAQESSAPSPASSAPPSTGSAPSSASCYPLDAEGSCYRAGEYCSDADHGDSGVAQNGEAIICENNDGWRWEPA